MSADFQASQYQKTIPSKSTVLPSDHQLEYKGGQTMRFEIPSATHGFIDPRQSYLKFDVTVKNSPAVVRFSNKCGIHSVIDNLRVYDLGGNVLENIQNYAELAEKLHYFSENRSIRNKRGMTELLEYTSRDFDGEAYDNLPSRNGNNAQLMDSYEITNGDAITGETDVVTAPNTCQVAFRPYSGILGALSTKMYPTVINGGLRVEIDLNTASKCLEMWSGAGVCDDNGVVISGLTESCRFGIVNAEPGGAVEVTALDLYVECQPGRNQVAFSGAPNQEPTAQALADGMQLVRNQLVGALNLLAGKRLHAFDNANPPVLQDCGLIQTVQFVGNNAGNLAYIRVNLTGTQANGAPRPNSQLFDGGAGRSSAGAPQDAKNNTCFIKESDMLNSTPELSIENVELVLKTAKPPQQYIDSLMKASQTAEGAVHDFMTFSTYRNNVQATEQIAQINIPAQNNMATAILSLPCKNGVSESIIRNNIETVVDNADNYSFLVNNKLQPTRKVPVDSLSETVPKTAQIALWEMEKSLGSSKVLVRNLDHQEKNFMYSRSLAKYGGVFKADGNLQLKVEYKNAPNNPTLNKLFISQIASLRRMRVSTLGTTVEY